MNNINKLTLEQEFKLTIYKTKIFMLNKQSAQKYLKQILKQMMIKDNVIKFYIKNSIT
uniref:Uncharacterized protein ycf18 n=1 Tax=Dipterocladia arabiensis TaxID=2007176 RepID=A0A1Z1M060_9FLOR|nr:phycobilisome degradation protein [Dipterocladia arabiensis]ARW59346.1 phycobilisome degradation protein [Dipterocladia arabiensis]